MNLRSRRDTSQPSFSALTPHFFRIVQENTLLDKRLLIPKKFVHKYGETLSSKVFVKLPCGSEWEMELRKLDGCVWLGKGWPEFAGHYSIGYGDLLVFRYEGNSRFHALIFDPSTVEIDYPLITSHFDVPKRGEITDDDSIEILEDYSLCTRKRKNSPLPHSRPQENSKTGPIVKTEIHFSQRGPNERTPAQLNEKIPGNSMSNRESHCSKSEMKGKLHFLAEDGDKDRLTTPIRRKCEAGRRMEQMTANDEVKALCRDSCFKSKSLTCKIVMQPSQVIKYYDMTFPRYFAREVGQDISGDATLTLSDGDGGTWPVKFVSKRCDGIYMCKRFLKEGWKNFVEDNNLKVGDVCTFELISGNKISFKVSITRCR